MAFVDSSKNTESRIAQAEQELATALANERPADAGAQIPKSPDEKPLPSDPNVPEIVDGVNWKDRYGNLQRYIDKNLKPGFQKEVDTLQEQIKGLTKQIRDMVSKASPSNLPETAAEVEKLKSENPSAYAAIMKVATDVAEGLVADRLVEMQADIDVIKRARKKNEEEAAFIELQRRFPEIDIIALEENEAFMNWIKTKSKKSFDALFGQKEDVDAASDVLQLYRLEVLNKQPASSKKKEEKPGSEFVAPKTAVQIPANRDLGYDFTESEIEENDKKDPRWFERNAEAIEKAMNTGRILKDISDPVGSQRRLLAMGVA